MRMKIKKEEGAKRTLIGIIVQAEDMLMTVMVETGTVDIDTIMNRGGITKMNETNDVTKSQADIVLAMRRETAEVEVKAGAGAGAEADLQPLRAAVVAGTGTRITTNQGTLHRGETASTEVKAPVMVPQVAVMIVASAMPLLIDLIATEWTVMTLVKSRQLYPSLVAFHRFAP